MANVNNLKRKESLLFRLIDYVTTSNIHIVLRDFRAFFEPSYGQIGMDNWQTYVDPDKKFTLFYPPGWTTKGRENFLSSVDLTLTNPNSTKSFQITISYIMNDSSLNYTGNEIIVPANNLRSLEGQL